MSVDSRELMDSLILAGFHVEIICKKARQVVNIAYNN